MTDQTKIPQIDPSDLDRLVWSFRRTAHNIDYCENTVRKLARQGKLETVEVLGRQRVVVASVKKLLGLDQQQVAA